MANPFNAAFIVDLILSLLAIETVKIEATQIGISTPYAGQVRLIGKAFRKAGLTNIRTGVFESFRAKRNGS